MKILLIGKFPPMQGGISARSFWLYRALEKKGYEFKVITINESGYSIKNSGSLGNSKVTVVNDREIPWHIPETKLLDDRLINIALKVASDFDPDLIETNYIWPFCKDALFLSNTLKKPFLIRHAGSDIMKFYKDKEFSEILRFYLSQASSVATNITSINLIDEICNNSGKRRCLQRYIPDPKIFRPDKQGKNFDVLFAGKINYHWNLKGLRLLLEVIKQKKLNSLFLIGGRCKDVLLDLISTNKLESYIEVMDFVHPEKMPSIYNSCRFVWCWEEQGTIEDFSNVIWEASFCNTSCILNSEVSKKIERERFPENFANLLCQMDAQGLMDFSFIPSKGFIDNQNQKVSLFEEYIKENVSLYKSLA